LGEGGDGDVAWDAWWVWLNAIDRAVVWVNPRCRCEWAVALDSGKIDGVWRKMIGAGLMAIMQGLVVSGLWEGDDRNCTARLLFM
jgi:hypothetical protein